MGLMPYHRGLCAGCGNPLNEEYILMSGMKEWHIKCVSDLKAPSIVRKPTHWVSSRIATFDNAGKQIDSLQVYKAIEQCYECEQFKSIRGFAAIQVEKNIYQLWCASCRQSWKPE